MKNLHCLIRSAFLVLVVGATPVITYAQETVVHYDNLNDPGVPVPGRVGLWHLKFGPDTPGGGVAQLFVAGQSGTVTSVTMGLARLEEPGGRLILDIRRVTESTLPGDSVGILGEVDINSLPEVVWADLPAKFQTVVITGLVEGLTPGERYFLVLEDEDAITDATRGWLASAVETPTDADPVLADWGPGGWLRPWTESHEFGPQHLYARIEGSASATAPQLRIERAVQISWPERGDAGVLDRASSPEGPWEAVTELVQTVDGENRVTILTDSDNTYFRLREE